MAQLSWHMRSHKPATASLTRRLPRQEDEGEEDEDEEEDEEARAPAAAQ